MNNLNCNDQELQNMIRRLNQRILEVKNWRWRENLLDKILAENFLCLEKKVDNQMQETLKV